MKIQIGSWEAEYAFFRTTAPRRYDGFGTITLAEYTADFSYPQREIAVQKPNVEWQRERYSSGFYTFEPEDDTNGAISKWAADVILKRILQKEGS